jgi:hypothetical protein
MCVFAHSVCSDASLRACLPAYLCCVLISRVYEAFVDSADEAIKQATSKQYCSHMLADYISHVAMMGMQVRDRGAVCEGRGQARPSTVNAALPLAASRAMRSFRHEARKGRRPASLSYARIQ